jgi:hypothetical protein
LQFSFTINDGFEESNPALFSIDEDFNVQFSEVHVDKISNGSAKIPPMRY